jgi:SAM-dependent methyltransferase
MFKSLHHVPPELMEPSMHEIRRVLKQGGLVYISEPVFAGDFNDILRLFHDEQKVNFAEFENDTIKATHSNHMLDDKLYQLIKQRFEQHIGDDGAHFLIPVRVDLLQKKFL